MKGTLEGINRYRAVTSVDCRDVDASARLRPAAFMEMAQEIAYLYGEPDLWKGEEPDDEKVTNQLILYCGVMLGASGAAQAVRLMSSSLAQQVFKKMPQKPPASNYYNPVIKSVLNFFAKSITKTSLAKGVSKAIPVIGGLVSGGITFASLKPMGKRLQETLDKAHFSYSDIEIQNDIRDIENEAAKIEADDTAAKPEETTETTTVKSAPVIDYDGIRKAKELLDEGIINEKEFSEIKARIISGK